MKKVKITDLPTATSIEGLYTFAASSTASVSVPLSLLVSEVRRSIPTATASTSGLMTAADKQRLSNTQTTAERDAVVNLYSQGKYIGLAQFVEAVASLPFATNATKSSAFGENPVVYGAFNFAAGWGAKAGSADDPQNREKYANFSTGYNTQASGGFCLASGYQSHASGQCSAAMCNNTKASGYCSMAAGKQTIASGAYSVALGLSSLATANNAFAMGWEVKAQKPQSAAFGSQCVADAEAAAAFGLGNIANAKAGFVVGKYAQGGGRRLFEVGFGTSSSERRTAFFVDTDGEAWFWDKTSKKHVSLSSLLTRG